MPLLPLFPLPFDLLPLAAGQSDPSWWDLLTLPILHAVEQLADHISFLIETTRSSSNPVEGALVLIFYGWPLGFSTATVIWAVYLIGKKTIVSFTWPHSYYGYARTPSGEVRVQGQGRPFGEAFVLQVTSTRFPPSQLGGATSARGEPFSLHLGFGVDLGRFLLVYYPPQPPSPDDWDEWKYIYFPGPHGYTRFPRFLYNFLTGRQDPDVFRPSFPSLQELWLGFLEEVEEPLLLLLLLLAILIVATGLCRRLALSLRLLLRLS